MSLRSSPYDAIGHVVCGLLILGACEAAHDGRWLIDRDWPPSRISLYMTMAYSIGQFVAALSHFLVEQTFVRKCLPPPEEVLLASRLSGPRRTWRQLLFPTYCQPLAETDQGRILQMAARDAVAGSRRAIFEHACNVVDRDEALRTKLDVTLHQARLWRNLCLGLLIVASILISGMFWHSVSSSWGKSDWRKLGYCLLALLEAVAMFYRSLKLYRRQALEVLTNYANSQEKSP